MSIDIEAMGIHELSIAERLNLIEQIWESLPEQVDISEVPEWHQNELAKRRASMDANPATGKPWREVVRQLEDSP